MSTVLWGARRGDVQYGSRAYWRTHIPIDPAVDILGFDSVVWFDVDDAIILRPGRDPRYGRIAGIEPPGRVGVVLDARA